MRPYVQELVLCQRHLQFNRGREPGFVLSGNTMVFYHFPVVSYRATPTMASALSSLGFECQPWQVGIASTGNVFNGQHLTVAGGDYTLPLHQITLGHL
jgi:hypothetical protein